MLLFIILSIILQKTLTVYDRAANLQMGIGDLSESPDNKDLFPCSKMATLEGGIILLTGKKKKKSHHSTKRDTESVTLQRTLGHTLSIHIVSRLLQK